MDMEQARQILGKYNKDVYHLRHANVVSGVMRHFASTLDPGNADYWAIVGLLHDVDFELYPDEHCVRGEQILREEGVGEDVIRSAMSHGWGMTGARYEPQSVMEKVLFATDELTGLIGAAALMRPSKSVADMEVKSVVKKFKDKRFAAGCSREVIEKGAAMLGWTLEELIGATIEAMRTVEGE